MSYLRFHFVSEEKLISDLDWAAASACMDRSTYVNFILGKMMIILDELDLFPMKEMLVDGMIGFSKNVIVKIKPEYLEKLKYLHFRFSTFSIATILRKILRVYLYRFKRSIYNIIKWIKDFFKNRIWSATDFETHMIFGKSETKRIIHLNSNNSIIYIKGYP